MGSYKWGYKSGTIVITELRFCHSWRPFRLRASALHQLPPELSFRACIHIRNIYRSSKMSKPQNL